MMKAIQRTLLVLGLLALCLLAACGPSAGTETEGDIGLPTDQAGHTHTLVITHAEPSCTIPGLDRESCSSCDYEKNVTIDPVGHQYSEYNCEKGVACANCGEVKTPGSGQHAFAIPQVITPATCDGAGKSEKTCTRCDHKETTDTEPLGHQIPDPTETKEPSATEDGYILGKCTQCQKTVRQILPALEVSPTPGGNDNAVELLG